MEEKELKIINHYGVMPQLKYFQSEVFELNEAIITYENDDYYYDEETESERKEHITEEIGDVQFMLNQFKRYYGIKDEEVNAVMIKKADRQLGRIENEKIEKFDKMGVLFPGDLHIKTESGVVLDFGSLVNDLIKKINQLVDVANKSEKEKENEK